MGSEKLIKKGPRLIDIDIIFYADIEYRSSKLVIPHPQWENRAFVYLPLLELPVAKVRKLAIKTTDDFQYQAHALMRR